MLDEANGRIRTGLGASSPQVASPDTVAHLDSKADSRSNLPPVRFRLSSPVNLGGSVAGYVHSWHKLTSDVWVLQTIQWFHK